MVNLDGMLSIVMPAYNEEKLIYNSIKEMDKRYSEILLFKYKFHYSAEQIAELLDLNVKTVYTRIDRGRKILKDRLLLMKGGSEDE